MYLKSLLIVSLLFTSSACGVLTEKKPDPTLDFSQVQLTPHESGQLASEAASNFFYGQGLGEAILNIGGIILTPWYAIYVVGNGIISVAGYEPPYVTNLLPNETKAEYDSGYNFVTSGPGRATSLVAGTPYRDEETIKNRYRKIIAKAKKHSPTKPEKTKS